jgi:murein DD-endopeptidase MepM/ murein hydrolase activator NlpD
MSFDPGISQRSLAAQRIDSGDQAALNSYQEQIKEINERSKQIQADQKSIAARQQNLLGEMKTLSAQIDELQQEIEFLEEQIAIKEDEIIIMEYLIELKREDVNLRTEYLNHRLVQIYMDGDVPLLDVLMESADITDFLTRFDMMTTLVDNDMVLLKELEEARAELEYQRLTLEQTRTLLEEDKETSEAKKHELQVQWDVNNELVKKLASDKVALEAAEAELAAASEQIKRYVADIQRKYPSQYMGDGTMGWPLPGHNRITSEYGMRAHPILKTRIFHSGLDIAAPKDTPVRAAETGVVIMAGSYGGYGNTVIIDHGGKVATQYSHMNKIKVKVGDVVLKGSEVGGVGTTGLSTGYHLHFEIMVDGATVNPLSHSKYFVKKP